MAETRENAREYIREHADYYLQRARRRGYICPICQNGAGRDGTGLESKDGIHFTCFKCNQIVNNDIVDIIGIVEGIDDDKDKFNRAYEIYGIEIDNQSHHITSRAEREAKQMQTQAPDRQQAQAKTYNFNTEAEKAHAALMADPAALKHYTDRGISIETIERFNLGYLPQGHNSFLQAYPENKASEKTKQASYKYVFPYADGKGNYVYFQTEIDDRAKVDDYNPKYRYPNNPAGDLQKRLYNEYYITPENAGIIFLCEGIYDALSVEQEGYKAIGGIGTAYRRILDICERTKTDAVFIIALDADPAGQDAIKRLQEGFNEQGIQYIIAPAATGKDYNEALLADRQAFTTFIRQTVERAEATKDAEIETERQAYEAESAADLADLDDLIRYTGSTPAISTGFTELDGIIDDGLRNGFYIIGAISSLGKTTFTLQICDNLAKQGQDVLFYSLEMSKAELQARSISRETYLLSLQAGDISTAKTTTGIMNGRRVKTYRDGDAETVQRARDAYRAYAGHIHIKEGIGNIGVADIEADIIKHKRLTGRTPVVFIDYLQLLSPYETSRNLTDKQTVDRNVLELKRLSRHLPVIAVSSFNRESYTEPVNLSSFKESGAVEYTSDVLIGLQYAGMDYTPDEKETERKKRVASLIREQNDRAANLQAQDIQLKVLKNRNGRRGDIQLNLYPAFNCFTGIEDKNPFTDADKTQSVYKRRT